MISAVVLTKNEEKNIKDCLLSLDWCDEILLVDDQSEDKTVAIARKLGAIIYQRSLDNNFAAQRNFGLEKAKEDWVLFVDADERVSPWLAKEIRETLEKTNFNGFYLKRRDWFQGKKLEHGEVGKTKLLRLGRKKAGKWQRQVHEIWQIKGKLGELNNFLDHYPHPTVSEFLKEVNFYSTLHAQVLYGEKIKPSLFRIIFNPTGKFIQNYFLRLGFLDGMPGLVVALMMSFHSFLARSKLYLLWKKNKKF